MCLVVLGIWYRCGVSLQWKIKILSPCVNLLYSYIALVVADIIIIIIIIIISSSSSSSSSSGGGGGGGGGGSSSSSITFIIWILPSFGNC
jgi:uncharacterized membrane protein YgcG